MSGRPSIVEAIGHVVENEDLTEDLAAAAMEEIMTGIATPSQVGAFLIALRMKGETAREIAGLARVMREKALHVTCRWPDLIDTCGAGGDNVQTFNVSTGAAFVAAGAGARVAKHGNRGVTKLSGSFDVLEALGISIEQSPDEVGRCIDEAGIGFIFAPAFHPAMRHAAPVRREIGVRSVFNLLGPLTNPAGAQRQVIGVPHRDLTTKIAEALLLLGAERALVVHGEPGIGEISTVGPTTVAEIKDGSIVESTIEPSDLGLAIADLDAIRGGLPAENAETLVRLLQNRETGPKQDFLVANAGAALVVAGIASDLRDGIHAAARSLRDGSAWERLTALRKLVPGDGNRLQ